MPLTAPQLASVLDMYAQQIMKAIQRDGFYIRVPSGTEFYLYVTQSINLGDATRGESADENRVRREEQEWRQQANRRAVNSANGFFQGLMGGGATEPEPPALLPPPKKEEPDPLEHLSSVPGSPRVDSQSAAQDFKSPFVNQVGEKP